MKPDPLITSTEPLAAKPSGLGGTTTAVPELSQVPPCTTPLDWPFTVTAAKTSVPKSGNEMPEMVRLVGEFTVRPVKLIRVCLSDCRSATVVSPAVVEKPVPVISSVV